MKDTLLRPTSTLSQPGSIMSEGDIRRRGRKDKFAMRNMIVFMV
jgi:hypothetical protein